MKHVIKLVSAQKLQSFFVGLLEIFFYFLLTQRIINSSITLKTTAYYIISFTTTDYVAKSILFVFFFNCLK